MSILDKIDAGELKVILGSKSPRRSELLAHIIPNFEIRTVDCEELFPSELRGGDIAVFLSELKSSAFPALGEKVLLITADTIVWRDNRIYEKPNSVSDAEAMLGELSGKEHYVYTGVTLRLGTHSHSFVTDTVVGFDAFGPEAISAYVQTFNPLDKAGAYGIQDCLSEAGEQTGPLKISIVSGSYTNVIGLPIEELRTELTVLGMG